MLGRRMSTAADAAELSAALDRIGTFDSAHSTPLHQPIEERCGRFYRTVTKPSKGPRGGHREIAHVECAACGHASPAMESRGSAVTTSEHAAMLRVLRVRACAKPIRPSAAARLLSEVTALVSASDKLPMRFAVEHRLGGERTLAVVIREAWDACDDGIVMGQLVTAVRKRGNALAWDFSRYDDDGVHVRVNLFLKDLRAEFYGTRESTALAVRAIVHAEPFVKRVVGLLGLSAPTG